MPLAVQGYDDRSRDYITTPAIVENIELLGLDRPGRPLRLRDSPIPPEEDRGWVEYLEPAGFREALALPLFAVDGRHLGLLAVHTDTPAHPTDAARDLIGALAPTLGHALDPMRFIMAGARLVRGATAGVVLARVGRPLPLPGLPTAPLLAAGSAVLVEVARQLADGGGWTQFLWPAPGPGSAAGDVRIAALGCAAIPPHHLVAAVVVAPPPHLHGLTPLQLQILGLLVEDWTNDRIAVALGVTPRAVAGHLQRIRAALGAATRDVATLRAHREGLYVPASFLDERD